MYSPELDDWIDVRQLSQGTLDQLYLCARLGIVRQVTAAGANRRCIFDDPFVTFDDERAARAGHAQGAARELQVIFLTTSDRYDAMADKVVVLTAPTERDEPERGGRLSRRRGDRRCGAEGRACSPSTAPTAAATGNRQRARQWPTSGTGANSHSDRPATPVAPLWPEER